MDDPNYNGTYLATLEGLANDPGGTTDPAPACNCLVADTTASYFYIGGMMLLSAFVGYIFKGME